MSVSVCVGCRPICETLSVYRPARHCTRTLLDNSDWEIFWYDTTHHPPHYQADNLIGVLSLSQVTGQPGMLAGSVRRGPASVKCTAATKPPVSCAWDLNLVTPTLPGDRTEHSSKVARFLHVWSLEQVKVELDLILLWTREKKVKKFKRKNVSRNIFIVESFHLHINLYLFIFRIISIRLTSQPNGSPIKSISFSFGQSPTNVKIKVGRFYIWCRLGSPALTCSDFLTKFSTAWWRPAFIREFCKNISVKFLVSIHPDRRW